MTEEEKLTNLMEMKSKVDAELTAKNSLIKEINQNVIVNEQRLKTEFNLENVEAAEQFLIKEKAELESDTIKATELCEIITRKLKDI